MGNLHNATYTYFLPIWEKKPDNLIHFFSHYLDTKLQKSLLLIFVAIKTRKWRYNAQLLQRKKKTNQKTNKRESFAIKSKTLHNRRETLLQLYRRRSAHAPKIRICAWGPPLWCMLNIGEWCMWRCLCESSATCISYIPAFPTWSN